MLPGRRLWRTLTPGRCRKRCHGSARGPDDRFDTASLVTVNCVIWGKVKREHPESLQEKITATVYSGSMAPRVTTKTLADLRN